jgi:signal transduction histidine kinase
MDKKLKAKQTVSSSKLNLPFQKRRQLERDIEHITAEMYRRNRELAETNKSLSLLRTIDALVLEPHASLKMVCEHIAQAIIQTTDYPFVGLLTRSPHNKEEVVLHGNSNGSVLSGQMKPGLGFSRPLHVKITHPWFSGFSSTILIDLDEQSEELISQYVNCSTEDLKFIRDQLDLKSIYIVKLMARRQIVGLLAVGYLSPKDQLNESDTRLLDHLSESIGVALDNKLLFDENQKVLKQIKESNTKLLALDEAKDDFISMASHQLRTPLTSVKGYISMILEGDAGNITPQQQKLLSQAFISSQRMVYIIADLLNVSRLRTGKFTMEFAPVNLADIIEQEITQLPELVLDDTKTRQIIMNFVDNAIYYTPAKGKIIVKLENKPDTVELKVTDNGIGVPKAEQAHLFTKFYRAANARKARPDGTGLGLFMAKKVIVAQFGALIFDSKEGKGSTFGFILNKAKLAHNQIK